MININDDEEESFAQKMQLESSLELLRRLHLKPFKTEIEFIDENMSEIGVIESGSILEIVDSFSDSFNVSDLFVEILIKAILPIRFNGLKLNGNQWNVIYLDLSMSLNPIRLAHRLSKRIDELLFSISSQKSNSQQQQQNISSQSQKPPPSLSQQTKSSQNPSILLSNEEKKKLIEQCLSRIQICRPKDPLELIATISNLPTLFNGIFIFIFIFFILFFFF